MWYNPGDGQYFLARSSAAAATQLLGVIDARSGQADTSVYTANKPNPRPRLPTRSPPTRSLTRSL